MIDRYADPTITEIWSRSAEIERWCQIEIVAMKHNPLAGNAWKNPPLTVPTPRQVSWEEGECGHEVIAFLRVWASWINDTEAERWLHYGLTSSDLTDTSLGMALLMSHEEIQNRSWELWRSIADIVAGCYVYPVQQLGRTHGQGSVPRPYGHPWLVAQSTLDRILRRLSAARTGLAVGKLSGPAGTHPHPWEFAALAELGLEPVASTQIVPRDGVAAFAAAAADLATFCEAVATRIRLLAQTGIGEVREGERVGSSAMPHKSNPARSENICGLARLARAAEAPLRLGLVQWDDRDLAHSSVERVLLPDLCHLTTTILSRTTALVAGLDWDHERIRANVKAAETDGSAFSYDRVMELQRRGHSYLDAHQQVSQAPNPPGTPIPGPMESTDRMNHNQGDRDDRLGRPIHTCGDRPRPTLPCRACKRHLLLNREVDTK